MDEIMNDLDTRFIVDRLIDLAKENVRLEQENDRLVQLAQEYEQKMDMLQKEIEITRAFVNGIVRTKA
jgi:phage host-nuclease inhibitor protein Gam